MKKENKPVEKGDVYISSMNMRGVWADAPENAIKVNVTSAQSKNSKNRRDFSPMTEIKGRYKGFYCFECYWQNGKKYDGISRSKTIKWWKKLNEPKRRYPGSKGKKVLYSIFDGEKMDYIESRKKVYVPEYYNLVKKREMVKYYKKQIELGNDIVVYDFDGIRGKNGDVKCKKVTVDLLKKKIEYAKQPFGHGYIVAGLLAGIKPKEYI